MKEILPNSLNSKKRAILCFLQIHFLQKNCPKHGKIKHQKNVQPLTKVFLEVMGRGKREIQEFLDELSKEKEEESHQESRNEKLEKLKVHDLRVDEKLFKRFLNDNTGDVKKILKNEKVWQKTKARDRPYRK